MATVGPLLNDGHRAGHDPDVQRDCGVRRGLGGAELLGGIAKALLNTASGLGVAIPASILYVFFISRVDRLVIGIDKLAQEVVNVISAEELHDKKPTRNRAA